MNMRKQRLMGAGLLAISAAMAALAWMGSTPEERDITAAVLLAPLGVWLLVTKEYVLYDSGTAPDARPLSWTQKQTQERSMDHMARKTGY